MASHNARRRFAAGLAALGLFAAAPASAKLNVVASLPDVADITAQIGGERVSVVTIAEGTQDPHKVPVKPSFVTKLNRADALVVQGLGLEHAFIPALLEAARNNAILPGAPGYIDASLYVQPLEVPTSQNRSQGELHPLGNPHFNLDPEQGKLMARAIAEGLARVDPAGASAYQEGLARFVARVDQKIPELAQIAAPLRGVKAVSYHQDLVYLAARYGIDLVGTIETKPGVPATPGHLEELLATMQRDKVKLVIREVSYDPGLGASLAERAGAKVVTISPLAGGLGTPGYIESIQANLEALVRAVQEGPST
ncbi:MAG TPA: metal ABC transporter substrate-binding protein [Myxococcota bacterium]|nr:metal ABC transporter substrate-binding protein [Myxococcota bacterium]